ncbi:hypothetical protein ACSFA3_03015 [Variovorax sp. RHLX14]|uniref:hypothetical protein n=1 Tax=Variovorax sp. RHLX14 TaxID=1259731 RepID=UPI003F467BFD
MNNLQLVFSAILLLGTTNPTNAHSIKSDDSFSLTIPRKWKNHHNIENENCQFLKNTRSPTATEWDLRACKYSGNLEEVLRFTAFLKEGKNWIAAGSMDQKPAELISSHSNSIFIETKYPPTCGIVDRESGFHTAGGECYSALVGCNKNYLLIESNGLNTDFSEMRKIARSVIFKECAKNSSIESR